MKFCYVDESGLGSEPYLVMVGIVVEAQRMHLTKETWDDFLEALSGICKRKITEFHARDFYSGNTPWRNISGPLRARTISAILNWVGNRRHSITFCAVNKLLFKQKCKTDKFIKDCNSLWCFAALHLILTVQKHHQRLTKTKGHTVFVFDREDREEERLSELVSSPPAWTDAYYSCSPKKPRLDQIIDVPYFADSRQVLLIQLADLIAYLLRRYAEVSEGVSTPKYPDEKEKLSVWAKQISDLSFPVSNRYPAVGRCKCSDSFYQLAPSTLRNLGR